MAAAPDSGKGPASRPADAAAPGLDPWSEWPEEHSAGTMLAVFDGGHHRHRLVALTRAMTERFGTGVVVAANRPAPALRDWFLAAGIQEHELRFIDCVAVAAGLPLPADGRVLHLPSPGMLELAALRAEQWLERLPGRRFLVLDSLSALALHNGIGPTQEFAVDLAKRLRRLRVPAALLVVDRQAPTLLEQVRPHVDGVLRL